MQGAEIEANLITGYMWFSAFGPIFSYYPQYHIMKKNNSVGSFSSLVVFIMIFSSFFRIIFYFGHKYDFCLFAQSLLMILIQFFLINEYYKILDKKNKNVENKITTLSKKTKKFLMFSLSFFSVYIFFFFYFESNMFIEMTGSISAFIEAFVPIPQWYSNKKNKSVESVSFLMIFLWALGDSIKFIYYLMRNQPFQFIICSIVQIFFDFSILKQFVDYKKNTIEVEKIVQELSKEKLEHELSKENFGKEKEKIEIEKEL